MHWRYSHQIAQYILVIQSFTASGKASNETAGYIAAIANHAAKLEPKNPQTPIITLENSNEKCLIQKNGTITGALYRHT